MRRTIFALTIIFLAPTAAMALPAGGELVGDSELGAAGAAVQKRQILPGGVAGSDQGGFLGGKVILAKGDKTGTGGGHGGHKGKQQEGKDNPGKQKGKNKS